MGRVVRWNVAGRVRSVAAQAVALAQRPVDVVALQEVRATALAAWEAEREAQRPRRDLGRADPARLSRGSGPITGATVRARERVKARA